ncbi:hypothetical protein C4K25_5541 [Pseudomonas chlororaphis]|nr:hypothetical protein C4K25_5541 [Pseudomonas chlororaphis]
MVYVFNPGCPVVLRPSSPPPSWWMSLRNLAWMMAFKA